METSSIKSLQRTLGPLAPLGQTQVNITHYGLCEVRPLWGPLINVAASGSGGDLDSWQLLMDYLSLRATPGPHSAPVPVCSTCVHFLLLGPQM